MNLKNRYLMLILLAFLKGISHDIPTEIIDSHHNFYLTIDKGKHFKDSLIIEGWAIYDKIHSMVGGKDQEKNFALLPVYESCFFILFHFPNKPNHNTYGKFNTCIRHHIFNATGRGA